MIQANNKRASVNVATVNYPCNYSSGDHLIYYCCNFLKLSISQRLAEIRKRRLFLNCLRSNIYLANKCKSSTCKLCGNKHNSLLHFSSKTGESSLKSDKDSMKTESDNIAAQTLTEKVTVTA